MPRRVPRDPRSFPSSSTAPSRWLGWPALLLVLLLPALLFLPGLGASGFAHSEAFRAQPAWEMLRSHDWLVVRLFEQPYLRKPPGMIWAIALSSSLIGTTEFAARLVSACAMIASAGLCWFFLRRWFGGVAGLVAGLAMTLMPILSWYPPVSRSAEIEALHNVCVLAGMLVCVDALLGELRVGAPHRDKSTAFALVCWAIGLGLAFGAALLTKGPAGLPALLGVLIVGGCVRRSLGLSGSRRVWTSLVLGLLLGATAFGAWWLLAARALRVLGEPVVTQTPGQFLFEAERLLGILTLPIVVLLAALPHSLLLRELPWRHVAAPAMSPRAQQLARAIALALGAGVLLSMLVGISNNRYVLPVMMLVPPCCGAAAWWLGMRDSSPARRRARAISWGLLAIGLSIAIGVIVWRGEVRRATRTSGAPVGRALGEALRQDMRARGVTRAQVWGDQMMDTRPEVVIGAVRVAREAGLELTPRWRPLTLEPQRADGSVTPPLPEVGSYLIVRMDMTRQPSEPPAEWGIYRASGVLAQLDMVFQGEVHIFPFRVYRRSR
jgi:4-amino-4-deoxy-L-arabinose transferase-like glycosyltransferase